MDRNTGSDILLCNILYLVGIAQYYPTPYSLFISLIVLLRQWYSRWRNQRPRLQRVERKLLPLHRGGLEGSAYDGEQCASGSALIHKGEHRECEIGHIQVGRCRNGTIRE